MLREVPIGRRGTGASVRTCRSFFEIPVAGGGEQGGASDGTGEEARICDGVGLRSATRVASRETLAYLLA